ncbi:MAG: phosphomannomutase/phosphoglucomutase [Patescibacteria group bacterium]
MDISKINRAIFKTYDVRGIYPSDVNGEVAEVIGRALGTMFGKGPVAVGRDMRLGSEELFSGLVKGLTDAGTNVHDLGLVPIDAVYFMVHKLNYAGAIMITASHNPKEYDGFKIVKKGETMEWIRGTDLWPRVEAGNFNAASQPGAVIEENIWDKYIEHIFSFIDVSKIKPLKVVVDAGNGLAGKVIPLMTPRLPIKIIPLFFELDGNFPGHPSNPLMPESQVAVRNKILETGADFGVIIDGDTDRICLVDEKGDFVRSDMTTLLLAQLLLKKNPGAGIAYNVICSRMVPEKIKEWGGQPLRSAVGFVNMAKAMRENNGVMGGELSGHYSFRDNGYADSGFIALLILLQFISESNQPLSEIVKPFQKYYKGDEVNFPLTSLLSDEVIAKLAEKYKDGKQDLLDGLTVEYPDWWVNVRPSNTEPLLRVTLEADNKELFDSKRDEILGFVKNLSIK